MRRFYSVYVVILVFIGLSAESGLAGRWWFSTGPNFRGGMKAKTSGSSYASIQARTVPQNILETYRPFLLTMPPWFYAGSPYDNGYIPQGNPKWDWGYDDNSQYDGSINFTKTYPSIIEYRKSVESAVVKDMPSNFSDTFSGSGLNIQAGCFIKQTKRFQVDICGGLSTIWGASANMSGSTYAEDVTEKEYTTHSDAVLSFSYTPLSTTLGQPPPFPEAPYRGEPGGPEYLFALNDVDAGRNIYTDISESHWINRNRIDTAVDTDLYSLWLGPRIIMQATERITVNMTPQMSVNYVDVAVSRREVLLRDYDGGQIEQLASWNDHGSKNDIIFGAGIIAGISFEAQNGIFATLSGGYQWLIDDVDVDVGPEKVSVDASGYQVSCAVGVKFGGDHGSE